MTSSTGGPGEAYTKAILVLSEDSIYHHACIRHVLDGSRTIGGAVCVTVAHERRKASEPLYRRDGDAPTVVDPCVIPLFLMPERGVDVTMRRTPGLPYHQASVVAGLENREEFSVVGVKTGFLHIRVRVMYPETEHNVRNRPIHGESAEPVTGQRYGCVSDMIEVDEVCPEVFERKEVVRSNGKDLSHTKPTDISEFLLYPELSYGQVGLPVGCCVRVERSVLREQKLGRNLGTQSFAP